MDPILVIGKLLMGVSASAREVVERLALQKPMLNAFGALSSDARELLIHVSDSDAVTAPTYWQGLTNQDLDGLAVLFTGLESLAAADPPASAKLQDLTTAVIAARSRSRRWRDWPRPCTFRWATSTVSGSSCTFVRAWNSSSIVKAIRAVC